MSAYRPSFLDEPDARIFLDAIQWGWRRPAERLQRLRFYDAFLERLASEPSHGKRDALIRFAAKVVFDTTIGALRRDLRAVQDLRRLEQMAGLPPRSAP